MSRKKIWMMELSETKEKLITQITELTDLNKNLQQKISELKDIGAELYNSNNQLHTIVNNLPGFISYLDKDHRYKFVNTMYARNFGMSVENILGKHISEVVGEEYYRNVLLARLEEAFAGTR